MPYFDLAQSAESAFGTELTSSQFRFKSAIRGEADECRLLTAGSNQSAPLSTVSAVVEIEGIKAPISVGGIGGRGTEIGAALSSGRERGCPNTNSGFIDIRIWFNKSNYSLIDYPVLCF